MDWFAEVKSISCLTARVFQVVLVFFQDFAPRGRINIFKKNIP